MEDDELLECAPEAVPDDASHVLKEEIFRAATKKQDVVDFQRDFANFTLLCLYTPNRKRFQITKQTQARLIHTVYLIYLFQAFLSYCLIREFLDDFSKTEEKQEYAFIKGIGEFNLFLSKFVVTLAMHLGISNLFTDSMTALKFISNHPDKFDWPLLSYSIAFTELLASAVFEYINIWILYSRENVYFTIILYINVELLAKMQQFYYHTVQDSPNYPPNSIFEQGNAFKIIRRSKEVPFSRRPLLNKVGWIAYKFFDLVYASSIFYFLPYIYLIIQHWFVIKYCNSEPVAPTPITEGPKPLVK